MRPDPIEARRPDSRAAAFRQRLEAPRDSRAAALTVTDAAQAAFRAVVYAAGFFRGGALVIFPLRMQRVHA